MRIICNSIGLNKETEVSVNGRRLVTQELSIKHLCELWKWYYAIAPFEEVELVFSIDKDFDAISQPTLSGEKSVRELFEQQGFVCKKFDEVFD